MSKWNYIFFPSIFIKRLIHLIQCNLVIVVAFFCIHQRINFPYRIWYESLVSPRRWKMACAPLENITQCTVVAACMPAECSAHSWSVADFLFAICHTRKKCARHRIWINCWKVVAHAAPTILPTDWFFQWGGRPPYKAHSGGGGNAWCTPFIGSLRENAESMQKI